LNGYRGAWQWPWYCRWCSLHDTYCIVTSRQGDRPCCSNSSASPSQTGTTQASVCDCCLTLCISIGLTSYLQNSSSRLSTVRAKHVDRSMNVAYARRFTFQSSWTRIASPEKVFAKSINDVLISFSEPLPRVSKAALCCVRAPSCGRKRCLANLISNGALVNPELFAADWP
jgi:hypothetical protein